MFDSKVTEILSLEDRGDQLQHGSVLDEVTESKIDGIIISAGGNHGGAGNIFAYNEVDHSDLVLDFDTQHSNPHSSQRVGSMSAARVGKKPSNDPREGIPVEKSEHDTWTTEQLGELKYRVGRLEDAILIPSVSPDAQKHENAYAVYEKALFDGYRNLERATLHKSTAQGDAAHKKADKSLEEAGNEIHAAALAILELRVAENLGKIESPLVEAKINELQMQLRETFRLQKSTVNLTSSWSLRSFWATDKNAQASRSVQKLAKNPAFASAKLAGQTDEQLEINAGILRLMTHAMYALTTFDQASVSTSGSASNLDSDGATSSWHQTPPRMSMPAHVLLAPPSGSRSSQKALKDISGVSYAKGVNEAVMDVIRFDLAEIQKEAGGLIGSSNPNRQFWGRVLMVLALVIATMVAAVAVMSMLGFATPAFLVPYFAAIQASSMVSTVLNFVAAKLTLDLNTAAAVTAVATAGTLGMFGKAIHYSGAPTQLKCDLDRAAQDLEAALSETGAANNMSMN